MKTILLYASNDVGFESRFQAALDLARVFGAHLNCLQVTPYDSFIMGDPFGGIYAMPTVLEHVRTAEAAHRAQIEERLRAESISWDWSRYDGSPAQTLASRSRLCDLVVVSLATDARGQTGPLSLGDLVLHARPPIMAVPSTFQSLECLGPAVAAWDGSMEASQALQLTLPILARASVVHIVTVSEDETEFPASDACVYLARHGLKAELHEWPRQGRTTAEALLDAAAVLRAGYLVMGAYGHSRLQEAILGGATRDMLRDSPIPLLLAH